jgi:hypothetical protein
VFSFLNTWSDFLTVAVIPALLATPSAALGDSVSSASVAARPIYGDDVLEDHGYLTPCPHAGHSVPGWGQLVTSFIVEKFTSIYLESNIQVNVTFRINWRRIVTLFGILALNERQGAARS